MKPKTQKPSNLLGLMAVGVGLLVLTLALMPSAQAEMSVSFDEGAPKDRFTFVNSGACAIKEAKLTLDLSGSKSGLIFDVTAAGAGVEVFQPLELVAGAKALTSLPEIKDGDNRVTFDIRELKSGEQIAFTIDVDDTAGTREITVSGSEIAGATVRLSKAGAATSGTFGTEAKAKLKTPAC